MCELQAFIGRILELQVSKSGLSMVQVAARGVCRIFRLIVLGHTWVLCMFTVQMRKKVVLPAKMVHLAKKKHRLYLAGLVADLASCQTLCQHYTY